MPPAQTVDATRRVNDTFLRAKLFDLGAITGVRESRSVRYDQRTNLSNEFLQKLIGVHEHSKMPTAVDRHKGLAGCLDGVEIISSEHSRSRKVLSSLNEKHRNRKFEAEVLQHAGRRLGDETLATQLLTVDGVKIGRAHV